MLPHQNYEVKVALALVDADQGAPERLDRDLVGWESVRARIVLDRIRNKAQRNLASLEFCLRRPRPLRARVNSCAEEGATSNAHYSNTKVPSLPNRRQRLAPIYYDTNGL